MLMLHFNATMQYSKYSKREHPRDNDAAYAWRMQSNRRTMIRAVAPLVAMEVVEVRILEEVDRAAPHGLHRGLHIPMP